MPDESSEDLDTFCAPFYVLRTYAGCWRCHQGCRVVALAAHCRPWEEAEQEGEEPHTEWNYDYSNDELTEICTLSNIKALPQELLSALTHLNPHYELRHSATTGTSYFMNTCRCGSHFGDFYLFSEPGAPFFPMTEGETKKIEIFEVPVEGEFQIDASMGMGMTGEIIGQGTRMIWPSQAA